MTTFLDPDPPEEPEPYCEELSLEDEIYDPADDEDFVDNPTDWDNDGFNELTEWEDYDHEPTWDEISDHDSNEGW